MLPDILLIMAGATSSGHSTTASEFGPLLFVLAVLVVGAKLGGVLVARLGQPSVLGELLFGMVLANVAPFFGFGSGIDFVSSNPTLRFLAEVGVLILLFDVGLESDLRAFGRVGASAILVAIIGVVVPFTFGWLTAAWFLPDAPALAHVFIGAALTATSVGITVRVLKDLGVTSRPEAQTIIGSAILDDILGLVVLAVVVGSITHQDDVSALSIAAIILKAVMFLGMTFFIGHFYSAKIVTLVTRNGEHGALLIVGIALCFTLAYLAEVIGLAPIIGAFAADVLLDPYGVGIRTRTARLTLRQLLTPLSEVFVPLFFVLMGVQVHISDFADPSALALGAVLILGAVTGKLTCGLGVVRSGINRLAVGIGMIPRGEVGLIFAAIGSRLSIEGELILSQNVYSAMIMMVLVTTLITPFGLRWVFQSSDKNQIENG
jgi:Kef-type K+ transport system membrane component KefB